MEFDYTKADATGVAFGSEWRVLEDGKMTNVIEERISPSVVHRMIEESKQYPDRVFVLGRLLWDGATLEQTFLSKETWNLIQKGKIYVLGADYLERYHESLGLPHRDDWVLLPDREAALVQYVTTGYF